MAARRPPSLSIRPRATARHWRQRGRKAWRQWTHPYDPQHPEAAHFRSVQVQHTLALTPWVIVVNWANAGVFVWTFRDSVPGLALGAWTLVTLVVSAAGLSGWRTWRAGGWPSRNSRRTLHRVTQNAALLALMWALPMMLGYSTASGTTRPLLVGLTVGMICAGGFALSPVPLAAFVYVAILAAGMDVGYVLAGAREHALPLLLSPLYVGIVLATVRTSARQMGGRLVAEADSARQKRLVDLLLDDFQENARDWLWELSPRGTLRYISPRLAEAFGQSVASLTSAPFVSLIRSSLSDPQPHEARAVDRLESMLVEATIFRDHHVPVCVDGEIRWWALSAKRLFDDRHQPAGWRGVGTDVTKARQQSAELSLLANFDTLTGLANRHQFQVHMQECDGRPFTLFYLDLDDFKTINDLHGHLVGDEVLKVVAGRFRSAVRSGDLLARIGGDEFALLSFDHTDPALAAATAQRLIDCLRAPIVVEDISVRVGTCVGIVPAGTSNSRNMGLSRLADMALYAAKAGGRNTYRFFEGEMEEAARRRLDLLTDLHAAVSENRLELHFQPLIRVATERIVGAEALLRWNHPTRGYIPPSEFVPLAEESGLIAPIGQWVVREACSAALQWPSELRVAVNLSPMQFSSATLADELRSILAETGLAPSRLELEITESLLIDDDRSARAMLESLRALGVRVALDDFGTGYSSLAYLRRYPLDALKIDGAFVASLDDEPQSGAVVRAIVQLAHALDMDVTAEGVETAAQFVRLKGLGCTDAQGFLLGRPMPRAALPEFFERWSAQPRRPWAA